MFHVKENQWEANQLIHIDCGKQVSINLLYMYVQYNFFLTFCANHNHAYSIVEHPNVPTPSPEGCPQNTKGCTEFGCPNTCYCADHCSWEKCKISPPPLSCLHRTDSAWQWNSGWWTAKKIGKYIVIFDHIRNSFVL